MDAESLEDVENQLRQSLQEVQSAKAAMKADHVVSNGQTTTYNGATATAHLPMDPEEFGEFALVINGHSLVSRGCVCVFV